MGQASVEDKLVNQPNLERPPKKGSQQYCELVTKIKGGEPFIRRVVVHGRPYWQKMLGGGYYGIFTSRVWRLSISCER